MRLGDNVGQGDQPGIDFRFVREDVEAGPAEVALLRRAVEACCVDTEGRQDPA